MCQEVEALARQLAELDSLSSLGTPTTKMQVSEREIKWRAESAQETDRERVCACVYERERVRKSKREKINCQISIVLCCQSRGPHHQDVGERESGARGKRVGLYTKVQERERWERARENEERCGYVCESVYVSVCVVCMRERDRE